ncbi:MAG TPA: anti-sigma factor [Bryobacteraceae bacterium]|jgi:anti-sigma-K factor RskA|nr:anti-sigma factor [Bryobacteraceae bacterium]
MTCDELREDYAVYALGILEDPERAEITEHLLRRCEICVSGVASALATVSALAGAVKIAEPPSDLRRRVVAMVDRSASAESRSKRAWSWAVPWGLAAALAIALIAVLASGVALTNRGAGPETAKLDQVLSILNDPATKDVSFGEAQPARGRVFVHASRGVVFIASHLPKIETGKTFELWVIPAAGNPIPAGTFSSDAGDTAMYVRPGPVEPNASAFAVTVEPAGGSALPTTKPFIVAALS